MFCDKHLNAWTDRHVSRLASSGHWVERRPLCFARYNVLIILALGDSSGTFVWPRVAWARLSRKNCRITSGGDWAASGVNLSSSSTTSKCTNCCFVRPPDFRPPSTARHVLIVIWGRSSSSSSSQSSGSVTPVTESVFSAVLLKVISMHF